MAKSKLTKIRSAVKSSVRILRGRKNIGRKKSQGIVLPVSGNNNEAVEITTTTTTTAAAVTVTLEAPFLLPIDNNLHHNDNDSNNSTTTTMNEDDSFLDFFRTSDGPPQLVLVCLLLALAFGSTIGVVPAVMMDRYARLNHGLTGDTGCSSFALGTKPDACTYGSEDAQNATAVASLFSNTITFLTSSLMGSISDCRGRKGILVLGIFLSLLSPLMLILIQMNDRMDPVYYYGMGCLSGFVNWMAVALSSLSDVVPPNYRAPSFGLLMAGFSLGFAFSPLIALPLGHFGVSVFSLALLIAGFLFVAFKLPETLPKKVSLEALRRREEESKAYYKERHTVLSQCTHTLLRPLRELSILNRNTLFRLLSALAFLSGMVGSADQSLLLYYVEDRLNFQDQDVAKLFVIAGLLGILVQGVLLKPLNDTLGERNLLMLAFVAGIVNNSLYGLATTKLDIYIGAAAGTLLGMSFPTISAIKSNNVDELEQGRIQGALYSLSSLAGAFGPVSLRGIYSITKELPYPGPGMMFLFAALLYGVAVVLSYCLPRHQTDSKLLLEARRRENVKCDELDVSLTSNNKYGSMESHCNGRTTDTDNHTMAPVV